MDDRQLHKNIRKAVGDFNEAHRLMGQAYARMTMLRDKLFSPPYVSNDDIPFDCLDLTTRAKYCIKNHGIETWGGVAALTKKEWLRVPNCGKGTVDTIEAALCLRGWKFKDNAND